MTNWSLLTCSPKLSKTLRVVKEIVVCPIAHIIAEAHDTLYISTPLDCIPKLLMFGKCFNPVHISELIDVWLAYARLHEGNEECHYNKERSLG